MKSASEEMIEESVNALVACHDLHQFRKLVEDCLNSISWVDPLSKFSIMKNRILGNLEFIDETIEFLEEHITEQVEK